MQADRGSCQPFRCAAGASATAHEEQQQASSLQIILQTNTHKHTQPTSLNSTTSAQAVLPKAGFGPAPQPSVLHLLACSPLSAASAASSAPLGPCAPPAALPDAARVAGPVLVPLVSLTAPLFCRPITRLPRGSEMPEVCAMCMHVLRVAAWACACVQVLEASC